MKGFMKKQKDTLCPKGLNSFSLALRHSFFSTGDCPATLLDLRRHPPRPPLPPFQTFGPTARHQLYLAPVNGSFRAPLLDIFLLRLFQYYSTFYILSDGIDRDGNIREKMQEVIWTAWFSSCLCDCESIVHLVCLCDCNSTRILSGDPGFVNCKPPNENPDSLSNNETYQEGSELLISDMDQGCPSNESSLLLQRVRYCKHCDAYVKGFDHHCPAFGNCIGQNNHLLFMILLAGFITAEACYIMGASQILSESKEMVGWNETLVSSTMIFSILQVLWQGVFLTWHIYCVCFNIRTDEFIYWKRYPEFQHIVQLQPGETITTTKFINPYDKGILQNLKEFIDARG
ncbi:unnamed protein product [Lactuca virosa]|uniref:S-acyltransferase n=1 Tax=Lactuca virosa TaxID=75947 RepID=A0AAU9M8K8_9ASTR|nr:unnamed protein product [Lactuca virosa]